MLMKGILLFIAIIGLTGIATAQDTHVAIVKNISGNIEILRDERTIQARPGMQLLRSDKVISGHESNAGIVFIDGTLITIGAATEIEVNQYVFEPKAAKYDFSLFIKKGTAIYSSGKLGKLAPDSVSLNTPRATVGIRGTRFLVKVD
jgi:hypothetical protein